MPAKVKNMAEHICGILAASGIHGEETRLQAAVLTTLSGGDNTIVMQLIDRISPELRSIITSFEERDHRLPTADEIIWILGEHHRLNPRYVDRLLADHSDESSIQSVKAAIQKHNPSIFQTLEN
jgi:hypothetical protein